jgi:hypothetical protein
MSTCDRRGINLSAYDFSTLSPLDFEDLSRDLFQAQHGILLESFATGRDRGIDFRYTSNSGTLIVQAKHYQRSGFNKLLSAIQKELPKILLLKPSRYVLITSVSLTPDSKKKLIEALPNVPLSQSDVWGAEDLNNVLGKHAEVERKHFKLWLSSTAVMEKLLHSAIYILSSTRERASVEGRARAHDCSFGPARAVRDSWCRLPP